MHGSTMQYLAPTPEQKAKMGEVRAAYTALMGTLDALPKSRYQSLALTALEESAMWANKGITRDSDGTPREGAKVE